MPVTFQLLPAINHGPSPKILVVVILYGAGLLFIHLLVRCDSVDILELGLRETIDAVPDTLLQRLWRILEPRLEFLSAVLAAILPIILL